MSFAVRALVVCAFCAVASKADADAIGIPADIACPAGTSLTANHAGHWCELQRACTADTECRDGELCAPDATAVCAATETYSMGGRLATDRPSTHTIRVGRGPCDASCVAPGSCDTARRCVPRPPVPPASRAEPSDPSPTSTESAPTSTRGCGVSPHGRASGLLAACAIGLGLVLGWRRVRW